MGTDPMAEIRAGFFAECEDLLQSLQDALSAMDEGAGDAETVNTAFRAVHSIKGGAAAFGLERLVGFSHRCETVLDDLRTGRLAPSREVASLFLQAADLLADHVRAAQEGGEVPAGETLLARIEALTGAQPVNAEPPIDFSPSLIALDFASEDDCSADAAEIGGRGWLIRLAPREGLYRSGNEALHLLRALTTLGRTGIRCKVPPDLALTEDAAEVPRLVWTIHLVGDVERAEIDDLFDFVEDVCDITIEPGPAELASERLPPEPPPAPVLAFPGPHHDRSGLPEPPSSAAGLRPEPAAPEPGAVTLRVDLEKIDRLVNLVGELVINQAMLSQSVGAAGLANPEVTTGLEAFMTLTRDLQDSVMSVRAQPVRPLFQRMARIVREASAATGKSVRLRTEGEGTEVDRTVIERLADPLTHMIRNAVDHGIETPEARCAAGKPSQGVITLSAFHRSGRIIIEVADDGAGIDHAKVQRVATARGLVAPDAALSEAEISNLLFLPGFSTAGSVSALSGRGVGMDVVKSAIAAIGGRISVSSLRGQGTTLSVSLPLTLAVLDGMVIGAAGQTFVVPLSGILETAALAPEAIRRVGPRGELLQIRGEVVPLVDLASHLGFRAPDGNARGGIVLLTARDDGGRIALVVDTIMEQRQVVIKGLGALLGPVPGVAAATILGDGKIALILDPADLAPAARSGPVPPTALAG
ncbi:chemotaxis protein CheA [Paracoccus sp. S-4012]|uniref:chemotaxis protein CheA n=1 Tax=Paracoccus sp. S-4012 TaxID=2665648 RepID=UPI0012AEFBE5|nr:chemotaxis protein CheA [Paracoccus sp. S-4012]MRX50700.1 chemotaxis protein CheA [Paracoccus sp. S-4012]